MRIAGLLTATLLLAAVTCSVWAQPAPNPDDRERLERERIRDLQEMARQQGMGAFGMVIGGDGRGNVMQMGGPGQAQMTPELLILVDAEVQRLLVIRGHTLYHYTAAPGEALQAVAEVDLRTPEEVERAEEAGEAFIWPDPATVPVTAEWSALSGSLMVLRGGVLMQFSPELECLAEFDLRTEREKQAPRVRVLMRPGPGPEPIGPLPPPPPPDAAGD